LTDIHHQIFPLKHSLDNDVDPNILSYIHLKYYMH
jgi:hypothetical protein